MVDLAAALLSSNLRPNQLLEEGSGSARAAGKYQETLVAARPYRPDLRLLRRRGEVAGDEKGQQFLKAYFAYVDSFEGRWSGDAATLEQAIQKLDMYRRYVEADGLNAHSEFERLRAQWWFGSAYACLGYFTRRRGDLEQAIRTLDELLERHGDLERVPEKEGDWLRAVALRDRGEASTGLLLFCADARIDGTSRESLDQAFKLFEVFREKYPHEPVVPYSGSAHTLDPSEELLRTRAILAVALAAMAIRSPQNKESLLKEAQEHCDTLVEEVKSRTGGDTLSFRWLYAISCAGFAASYLYHATGDAKALEQAKCMLDRSARGYEQSGSMYAYRSAVNDEGYGDVVITQIDKIVRAKRESATGLEVEDLQGLLNQASEYYKKAKKVYAGRNEERAEECAITLTAIEAYERDLQGGLADPGGVWRPIHREAVGWSQDYGYVRQRLRESRDASLLGERVRKAVRQSPSKEFTDLSREFRFVAVLVEGDAEKRVVIGADNMESLQERMQERGLGGADFLVFESDLLEPR